MEETIKGLTEGLANALEVDEGGFDDTTRFRDLEEWDSLNHLSFLVEIEERFGKTVPREEFEKMQTLGDIAKYLNGG